MWRDHRGRIRGDEAPQCALRDIVVHVDDFPFDFNVATANKPAECRMAA
jgi:hypothetical protein